MNRQDQLTSKMIMPGIIQVLAVSPCNSFCVGAASEQIMIWQFSTGKMVASVRRHYQNVSNIKFTADSSYFVSTGTEGLVLVWSMESVLNSVVKPRYFVSIMTIMLVYLIFPNIA